MAEGWIPAGGVPEPLRSWQSVAPAHARFRYCPLCAAALQDRADAVNAVVRSTCPACGWIYYPTTLSGALMVVAYAETGELVVIEPPGADGFALPGGIAEYAETPEECAVREVREETGLEARVDAELCRHLLRSGPFGPMLQFGFSGTVVGGELREGDEGPGRVVPLAEAQRRVSARRTGSALVLAAYADGRPGVR